jgi:uncharacterized membrane protein
MDIKRILKHLSSSHAAMRRIFPRGTLSRIEHAIADAEKTHAGQICFVVEDALALKHLLVGLPARERAIEVFSHMRVWDTEHNNGVLIYLLLADRVVEIVADRGVHAKLGQATWDAVCREMETEFRQGRFEEGAIAGIRKVGEHLTLHYPHQGKKINELPDHPVLM